MCGIAGFVGEGNIAVIESMTRQLKHRGPDYQGTLMCENVGLGHARLSIIDLSSEANQPMVSVDGLTSIVFNGEIYNFKVLKEGLEKSGLRFKTQSDTEVLLSLYQSEKENCLSLLNGMFAFAIHDRQDQSIFLARDRVGKKPLYYAVCGQTLVFGSEIKAILSHPLVSREIDPEALNAYLTFDYVPAPMSIFKSIRKVLPGAWIRWKNGKVVETKTWWKPPTKISNLSFQDAKEKLDSLLEGAVQRRMISDVPLGVFLSGGIDSSTVAWYAQNLSKEKIQTFSIGFSDPTYDESSQAILVAKKLGTEHHQAQLTATHSLELLNELDTLVDEPFADPSLIPTYFLSKFTRQKVTVSLGGDGADEFLAGYPTFISEKLLNRFSGLKPIMGPLLSLAERMLPASDKNISLDFKIHQFLKGFYAKKELRHTLWLSSFSEREKKNIFNSNFSPSLAGKSGLEIIDYWLSNYEGENPQQTTEFLYLKTYLADDILVKVDRASMYNSLEVRAPFLDYELVEFLSALPIDFKLNGLTGKYILKSLMRGRLPDEIIDRPKKGFGIPLSSWLRNELKSSCTHLLSVEKIKSEGIFNPHYVNEIVNQHQSKRANHRKLIWNLMVFQKWKDRFCAS